MKTLAKPARVVSSILHPSSSIEVPVDRTPKLFIGGKQVASATGGSLSYNWNTRKLKAGSYTLRAVARDAAGNTAEVSSAVTR